MAESQAAGAEPLGALYEEHHAEMVGYARRQLDAAEIPESELDAEDVVHAAFTAALRAPGHPLPSPAPTSMR